MPLLDVAWGGGRESLDSALPQTDLVAQLSPTAWRETKLEVTADTASSTERGGRVPDIPPPSNQQGQEKLFWRADVASGHTALYYCNGPYGQRSPEEWDQMERVRLAVTAPY